MTWVIVAFSQVDGSRLEVALVRVVQRLFTRGFLRAVGPLPPPLLEAAAAYRLRDHNLLPAEAARIRRWAGQRGGGPDAGQGPPS
ncbi:MAG TPA: hypothetical protein VK817_13615 [Trebonia sp.]|jgi:hypothetical protein|nr:hypothetical protein [Trebonia sp.]